MWPIELFWSYEVREILYPPKLDVLSLSSLHSMALLRMNSTVKFWPKWLVCFPIISLPCFLHRAFDASGVGHSVWKPFSPIYTFLDMMCSLEKKAGIYLEKPATLLRIVSEPIHICPESFKELTCRLEWEFGVRFCVVFEIKIGRKGDWPEVTPTHVVSSCSSWLCLGGFFVKSGLFSYSLCP